MKPAPLYLDDTAIAARIGVTPSAFRAKVAMLEGRGFPSGMDAPMNTRDILAEQWAAPRERTVYVAGELDECVVFGSAHLERLDGDLWFLSMVREDGTELAVRFTGKVSVEERKAK